MIMLIRDLQKLIRQAECKHILHFSAGIEDKVQEKMQRGCD